MANLAITTDGPNFDSFLCPLPSDVPGATIRLGVSVSENDAISFTVMDIFTQGATQTCTVPDPLAEAYQVLVIGLVVECSSGFVGTL